MYVYEISSFSNLTYQLSDREVVSDVGRAPGLWASNDIDSLVLRQYISFPAVLRPRLNISRGCSQVRRTIGPCSHKYNSPINFGSNDRTRDDSQN